MTAEDSPDPDLKDMNLLMREAPDSEEDSSEEDPPLGNVSVMVDVEDAFSETMVSPLESVVTDATLALEAVGEVEGRPGNSSNGDKREESPLFPDKEERSNLR